MTFCKRNVAKYKDTQTYTQLLDEGQLRTSVMFASPMLLIPIKHS